jgi:predicted DCC family thiol-disulfide oxidoreductase YuxK
MTSANPILLYDGVCGLCNRLVQFVLKRDASGIFRFAALQSNYAAKILQVHHLDPQDLNTVYVVDGEQLFTSSDAVIFVLRRLGGLWKVMASALRIFPRSLRDWGYKLVASNRYLVFGKYQTCPLPQKKYENRFLNL